MSDADWMPGCVKRPGLHAGYNQGTAAMDCTVLHFTVGRDSTSIGDAGYFNWLVPKDGPPIQFAEANSITWHAGSWNGDGPGIEFERMGYEEPLTDSQTEWGGRIIRWLSDNYGIPTTHYDGPRVPVYKGFINHGSLLGRGGDTQDHTDGVTDGEWSAMFTPAPPPASQPVPGDNSMQILDYQGTTITFHINANGDFVQNTYEFGKGRTLIDKVVVSGNDPNVQPGVILHGDVISCCSVDTNGLGRYFSFLPRVGWVDAGGNPL